MSEYIYSGKVSAAVRAAAEKAYRQYRADKDPLLARIRDDEQFYKNDYSVLSDELNNSMHTNTPLIFSAIENARADAIDNFPSPNILEREPQGSDVAKVLSKIIPSQLEISDFRKTYKTNVRNKLKYGTAIYGVFYNDVTENIDIRAVDILNVFVDMHIEDVQESRFLFITAVVENELLKEKYPRFKRLFSGDTETETLTESTKAEDSSTVMDVYYKTLEGRVHMYKLCRDTIIAATEDMAGYEGGLYNHSLFPVVFDILYPSNGSPFGFGMTDIGKGTQISINKLDRAISENIMCNAKPRYLAKRNGGIDEEEFRDLSRSIVHYEGDTDAVKAVEKSSINEYYLSHRERKKEELKEILANRDFQQGATSGGVTAASAIETLRQTGEKRTRAIINDTYDAYRRIVYMMLELMRQFYAKKRTYRIYDDLGQKNFMSLDNSMMYKNEWSDKGVMLKSIMFDIDVVPQRENPFARESMNETIMNFWNSGMLQPENAELAVTALKNMNFDGKEQLIADIERLWQKREEGGEI